MSLTVRVFAMTLLGVLSVPAGSWAQNQPGVEQSRIAAGTAGETLKAETATDAAAKESAGIPHDPENRKTEILALEHQVEEKQQRIELLMRIFVRDEQAFLKDPSGQLEDDESRAKRRFEQQELLVKAKEIAQLKTRLNMIASAGREKIAPPAEP